MVKRNAKKELQSLACSLIRSVCSERITGSPNTKGSKGRASSGQSWHVNLLGISFVIAAKHGKPEIFRCTFLVHVFSCLVFHALTFLPPFSLKHPVPVFVAVCCCGLFCCLELFQAWQGRISGNASVALQPRRAHCVAAQC